MTASIANQDAIEHLCTKVINAREQFAAQQGNNLRRQVQTSPSEHYHIAKSARTTYDLSAWLGDLRDDPAVKNFLPRLKDYLYARVQGLAYEGDENDFTDAERNSILITDNKLFEHSIVRINYTTYDLRREQDSINPRTRADLMVMSHEEDQSHPYWYARLIKIFHVNVEYHETPNSVRCRPKRMDFLFVRWFKCDTSPAGFTAKRLQRLEFFEDENPDAYGFLDPECVIRGVHIIPGFAFHRPEGPQLPTIGRREADPDWVLYYVNMFVDRDMFMRFRGGAVGHKGMREWDDFLQREGHVPEDSDDEIEDEIEKEADEAAISDASDDDSEVDEDLDDDVEDELQSDEDDILRDDEEDEIIAEYGEELDDNILMEEGYGTL